jgi:hypothetical protein
LYRHTPAQDQRQGLAFRVPRQIYDLNWNPPRKIVAFGRAFPTFPSQPRQNDGVAHESDRWPLTCSTCGGSRDGLDDDAACPSCGSTAKTVHVSFHEVVGVTESFGITALYEKQRPWQEKWQEVGVAYDALFEVYSGSVPGDPKQWKAIALTFFRACHELPDAIASDDIPALVIRRIRRAAQRRAVLRLVADVDNTRKHGGRDPDKCHARVGEISWGDHDTPTMAILLECPNSPLERIDVRDTATAAMDAWRAIISRHGLIP